MHALISSRQKVLFMSCFQAVFAYCQLGDGQIQMQPLQPNYISAQPIVAAQPMVTGSGMTAGQQMVGAQPMIACQPLIAGQPVVAGQQMVSAQPMVAIPVSNQ